MSNINFKYTNLTPFKWYVLENFPFIEADFDALTNWQLFCKLGKEINKIINSVNLSGQQVENLTNAFNDLKNYVDNYFNNLDVQEEINNKLDQMVQDGTLANIINEQIFQELNDKINQIENKINELEDYMNLYLPDGKKWQYGQFLCLGKTKDKAVLFDTGYNLDAKTNLQYLKEVLQDKKLDYVIVSHYHIDHSGGLTEFTDLYDENTIFYLQKSPLGYYSGSNLNDVVAERQRIIDYLTTNNYTWVDVNQDYKIELSNNIYFNILASNTEAFKYYSTIPTDEQDYNTYSMNIQLYVYNQLITFGFDGTNITQTYLNLKNQVGKSQLLFNFHHGNQPKMLTEYLYKLAPEKVVNTLGPVATDGFVGTNALTSFFVSNCKYYDCCLSPLTIEVSKSNVIIIEGDYTLEGICNNTIFEFWLDPTFTGDIGEPLGTEEKPFQNFNQLFKVISKLTSKITVNVKSGYLFNNIRFMSLPCELIINGDTKNKPQFRSCQINNCSSVQFNNIEFTEYQVITKNSHLEFNNCDFNTTEDVQCITLIQSNAYISMCKFTGTGLSQFVVAKQNSDIAVINCTFTGKTSLSCVGSTNSIVKIYGNTFTNTIEAYYRLLNNSLLLSVMVGSTAQRPNLGNSYYCQNFIYYDSQIKKPIIFNIDSTTKWKDFSGNDV